MTESGLCIEEVNIPKKREVLLRVANTTDIHKLATSIQKNMEEGARTVVSCVGVQTVNSTVKAVAVANSKTVLNGYIFVMLPIFHSEVDPRNEDHEYSVIRFVIIKHLIGS